jgi:hypothetical protein
MGDYLNISKAIQFMCVIIPLLLVGHVLGQQSLLSSLPVQQSSAQQGIPGVVMPEQGQEGQEQLPAAPQSPPAPSESESSSSSPSPSPLAQQQQEQEQQQEEGVIEGVTANGIIDSLIFTPSSTWIATGNWTVGVNNGTLALVSANMTWYNDNGTASHTHELLNFRPIVEEGGGGEGGGAPPRTADAAQPALKILVQPDNKSIFLRGIVDVGANDRIAWKNVDSVIYIKNGGKILSIFLDDAQTNNHFGGRPIFGIVNSFIRCSNTPGPNMEILPPCLNIPSPPPLPPPPPQSAVTTPAAGEPNATTPTGKSPFDILGGG